VKVRVTPALGLLLALTSLASAQKVIRLYPGPAPGSEKWTNQRREYFSPIFNAQVVTNVTQPSLIAFTPAPKLATGTAVVICPGGGFHALSINSEGIEVARWLSSKGVAAFVLEYRLVPTGDDGVQEFMMKMRDPKKLEKDNDALLPLAVADARAAITYVRKHANELGVSPSRVGLMGFSAGGVITAAIGFDYTAETRPDFLVPIYAGLPRAKELSVHKDAPPLFVAAATDDRFGLTPDSVTLYSKWLAAGKPAELHIYSKGGHGFGMKKQNLPSDHWIDRFGDWLQVQGLLKPIH
jgi:acetyl esterase/lipase